ncbi:cytidylyltransferase [Xylaria bambusicola]|uniref:cytidylyltransferase n=1 Tax=Xylaria bambusicola TaxID=326684 RepID=UPI0020074B4B|nr:cytidylyltransferase [Xylaria bambusicola]KAI0505601.1 cytidylyltransferase [Xylaria bambusicola]
MERHRQSQRNPSLLLLPPPPQPADHTSLSVAYEPAIKAAITKLKNEDHHSERGSVLFVGISSAILSGPAPNQKSLSWPAAQSVLARIYSIVALICAQLSVPSEMHAGPDSIDVRVLFIHYDPSRPIAQHPRLAIDVNNTIIIDLHTFASAYHPWHEIFHVNSEPGYRLFTSYMKIYEQVQTLRQDQLIVVESGLSLSENPSPPAQTRLYPIVCLGGTFDHLHAGHKLLLTAAALLLKVPDSPATTPARFIIGITGDELLKRKKYAEFVQPWDLRVMNVIEFLASLLQLSKQGWVEPDVTKNDGKVIARFRDGTIEIHCVMLQDAFGPTTAEEEMDALVVSGETRSGGDAVNARRRELGWHELEIFEVDVLDAGDGTDSSATKTDFATKISSTAIRERKAGARK